MKYLQVTQPKRTNLDKIAELMSKHIPENLTPEDVDYILLSISEDLGVEFSIGHNILYVDIPTPPDLKVMFPIITQAKEALGTLNSIEEVRNSRTLSALGVLGIEMHKLTQILHKDNAENVKENFLENVVKLLNSWYSLLLSDLKFNSYKSEEDCYNFYIS